MNDLSKHCKVCENRLYDFKTGTRCKITDKRPKFNNHCRDIDLGKSLIKQIQEVEANLKMVLDSKGQMLLNAIVFGAVSIAIILLGLFFGLYLFDAGWISPIPLIIMVAGFAVLPFAAGPVNKYNRSLKRAKEEKQGLEKLATLYKFDYEIDITIKERHGIKHISGTVHIANQTVPFAYEINENKAIS